MQRSFPQVSGTYDLRSDVNENANREYRGVLALNQSGDTEDVTGSYSVQMVSKSTGAVVADGSGPLDAAVTTDGAFSASLSGSGIRLSGRIRGDDISGTLIHTISGPVTNDLVTGSFVLTRR